MMIKCPECHHHISSMAKACPECGAPIDPEWAEAESEKEMKRLQEVPFTVNTGAEEVGPEAESEDATPEVVPEDGAECDTPTDEAVEASPSEPKTAEAEPVPAAGKGGGRSSVLPYAIFIVVLLLLIGGIYYYDYHSSKVREQHAYEMLKDCSSPDFYEDFIIRYPKSPYIEEVRERYNVVARQQAEWQQLIARGTRDDLNRFVREHPTSPYVKVAQGRIDSLDWAEAKRLRTEDAVTHYLVTHPEGYYVDQAEQLRQTLERQRAEAAALEAAMADSLRVDSIHAAAQP